MRIWILRHGQAEPMAASDSQRALTEHGRAEVRAMLPLFDDTPLDVILVSPYRRAQQTAELVSRGLAHARGVATAAWLTPDDDPRQALDFLGERSELNVLLVTGVAITPCRQQAWPVSRWTFPPPASASCAC